MLQAMTKKAEPADPAKLWARATKLEEQARALRFAALDAAIEQARGILGHVAKLVGAPRSTVRTLLAGPHYGDLWAKALELRAKTGYATGRVPGELRLDGDE